MNKMTDELPQAGSSSPYWRLLRDVLVFQGKLALDGLRDLLLSPLSIILAIAGAILSPEDPHCYLRRLMKFGLKSDQFINLFEHPDPAQDASRDEPDPLGRLSSNVGLSHEKFSNTKSSNTYVKQLEDLLVDAYNKGGIVKEMKEGTDDVVRKLLARRKIPPNS
ncbi:MAG: hypothetical protein ACI9SB_000599 [Candidatus Azotimanducaceae bacterium]|jgi:hypothetical protein